MHVVSSLTLLSSFSAKFAFFETFYLLFDLCFDSSFLLFEWRCLFLMCFEPLFFCYLISFLSFSFPFCFTSYLATLLLLFFLATFLVDAVSINSFSLRGDLPALAPFLIGLSGLEVTGCFDYVSGITSSLTDGSCLSLIMSIAYRSGSSCAALRAWDSSRALSK